MKAHYQDDSVVIHKFDCGRFGNNAYLVVCPQTNESILIDLPEGADKLVDAAKKTVVRAIVLTHNHMDHLLGYDDVTGEIKAPIGIGRADADALPRPADFFLEDGAEVKAGTISLKAIETPGHTPGSHCLVIGNHLFSGDTLFPGGPGKTGSPADLKQIIESITDRLLTLPDDTAFYPGHGDDGDIKTAREDYAVFASREHPAGLSGDVAWLETGA